MFYCPTTFFIYYFWTLNLMSIAMLQFQNFACLSYFYADPITSKTVTVWWHNLAQNGDELDHLVQKVKGGGGT